MSNEGTAAPANEGQPALTNLQVVGQYIKDLSFENPGISTAISDRPQIAHRCKRCDRVESSPRSLA